MISNTYKKVLATFDYYRAQFYDWFATLLGVSHLILLCRILPITLDCKGLGNCYQRSLENAKS